MSFVLNDLFLDAPEFSVEGGLPAHLQLERILLGKYEAPLGLFWIVFGMFGHFLQELFEFVALAFALVVIEAMGRNVIVPGVEEVVDFVFLIVV